MTDIDDTLKYIESVKNAFLNGTDSCEINSRISSIQKKREDTKLYLAVIGEFSSGKSTFINALLGIRLLKEAVTPTTACATYIECHSKILSVKIAFFDGRKFKCTEHSFDDLKFYIDKKFSIFCKDLYQIITVVTSDQKVARTVSSLKIDVPGDAIPENIVIIDTPGFNPGSSSVDNHQEITKDVVENIADSAIILTSQEQAMSATLSRFLKDNLKRCLHRCIYVVTKFDTLEDDATRQEVLQYVRDRIVVDLNVSNPRLFGLSAVTMLPVKKIPFGKEDEWPVLKRNFLAFKSLMWSGLKQSKDYVLSEHIDTLVKEIAQLCIEKLNAKEKDLQEDKAFLEAHRVETIQIVTNKMLASASNALTGAISSIQVSFSSAEAKSKSSAETTINTGAMTLSGFRDSMMPKIKSDVENHAQEALTSLNNYVNSRVGLCVRTQIETMSNVFASHYSQFPKLKPTESVPRVDFIKFKNPNLNFNIALSKIENLESIENRSVRGGVAGGTALGALFGGPVGAIVGAGIGFFGGIIAGDQSDSMRTSAIPVVKDEISSFYSALRIKIDNELKSLKSKYSDIIKKYAEEHISKYGESVQYLISQHQRKITLLNEQITSLRNTVPGLQNIQDDIEHELAILKIK